MKKLNEYYVYLDKAKLLIAEFEKAVAILSKVKVEDTAQDDLDKFKSGYGVLMVHADKLHEFAEELWLFYYALKQESLEKVECGICGGPLHYWEEGERFDYPHGGCGEAA